MSSVGGSSAVPRVEWATLADYALIDSSGKLSVLGMFDRLFASPFPSLHPLLFIVARWSGQPTTMTASEIRVWSPGRELLVGAQQPIQFGPDGSAVTIARLSPLPIPAPGEYTIELLVAGASAHHLPMTVEAPSS
jgi:hypothetical protein